MTILAPSNLVSPRDAEWIIAEDGSEYLISQNTLLAVVGAGGSWMPLVGSNRMWRRGSSMISARDSVIMLLAEARLGGYRYRWNIV